MRSTLIIIALGSTILVWGSAAVIAQPISDPATTVFGNAPVGHLQPRAQPFSPQSSADQDEQRKMSKFDEEQQRLDEELDKKLNICRC